MRMFFRSPGSSLSFAFALTSSRRVSTACLMRDTDDKPALSSFILLFIFLWESLNDSNATDEAAWWSLVTALTSRISALSCLIADSYEVLLSPLLTVILASMSVIRLRRDTAIEMASREVPEASCILELISSYSASTLTTLSIRAFVCVSIAPNC